MHLSAAEKSFCTVQWAVWARHACHWHHVSAQWSTLLFAAANESGIVHCSASVVAFLDRPGSGRTQWYASRVLVSLAAATVGDGTDLD